MSSALLFLSFHDCLPLLSRSFPTYVLVLIPLSIQRLLSLDFLPLSNISTTTATPIYCFIFLLCGLAIFVVTSSFLVRRSSFQCSPLLFRQVIFYNLSRPFYACHLVLLSLSTTLSVPSVRYFLFFIPSLSVVVCRACHRLFFFCQVMLYIYSVLCLFFLPASFLFCWQS